LLASTAVRNPNDVRHGEGQYLTDIGPGALTPARLSRALVGHPFCGHRFCCFLAIETAGLRIIAARPGVFVVPGSIPLPISDRIRGYGHVPGARAT
jgi:hypothetical protein